MRRVSAKHLFLYAASLSGALALSAGCTVGPNYNRPAAAVPAKWDTTAPGVQAAPMDNLPKGAWWSVFHDDQLDALEQQVLDSNQDLKVSIAHFQQARATAAVQVSTLFPTFGLVPNTNQPTAERVRQSGGRVLSSSIPNSSAFTQNTY